MLKDIVISIINMWVSCKLYVNNILKCVYILLHVFKNNYKTWNQVSYKRENNIIIILKMIINYIM